MAWNLVPVEGDPFKAPPAGGSGWSFEPVKGDPFATKVAQAEELPAEPAAAAAPDSQSYVGALANAAVQGAVGGVGSAVEGVGEMPRGFDNRAATSLLAMMDRVDRGERSPNPLATPAQIIQYQGATPERRAELRAKITGLRQEAAATPPNALMEAGRNIQANVQQDNPVSPAQEGFGTGVARSAGSLVTALPTMIIGGAAGGPGGAALGASAIIWPQTYAGTLDQARAKGVPEEEAVAAAMTNATTQAGIMSLPVARVFGRIPTAFREPFAKTLVNLGKGGVEFGSLTALGTFADNYVAKQTFDPDRELTHGVADKTLEGAFLGALIPLGGVAARGVTQAGRRATAPMADRTTVELAQAQQALADIAQGKQPAPNAPPSVESAPSAEPPAMRAAIETLDNIATGVKPGEQAPPPAPGMSPELSGALEAGRTMAAEQRAPAPEVPPADPRGSPPPVAEPPAAEIRQPEPPPPVEQAASPPPEPAAPPAPTRNRTQSEIQQMDGVGPREAQRIQTAEIEAIGRPISAEDMAARKAGVSVAPPRRAAVPEPVPEAAPVAEPAPSVESVPAAEPFKAYTPSGVEVTLRPELVDLSQLVPSNAPDGRVNPVYPGELQPRDRSQPASQAQVQEIAGNLRPELLAPGPDVTTGAPIIGPDGAVESGNGRIMALTRVLTDPALAPKRDAYMAWLESQGYDASGMENPVLVSRRVSELTPEQRPVFAIEANDRTNMAMSPAEAARADATRAAQAMSMWEGTSATSASNRGFVRAFMGALPATERGRMIDSHGNLSPEGSERISRAVMAHAYGDEAGGVLNRFLNSDSEGMKAVAGAMQDMAGGWAQMRAAAERGDIPRSLDITRPLIEAVQTLAEARRLDRPVKEVLSQVDFEKPPVSAEAVGILRNFFRDEGMRQPAGRKAVGDFMAEYAARAQKQRPAILEGHTVTDPTEIMRSLRGEAPKGQDTMFAAREAKAAEVAAEASSKGQPEIVKEAREQLYRVMQEFMRHVGLPPRVGLKLVDQLLSPAADAAYHRGLIEFALDTKPGEVPLKLFHEVTHALLDPKLGLLTPAETKALNIAADRWLKKPENRASLERAYPKADAAVLREEAVARLAEEALSYGMREPPAVTRAARNMRNFVVGVGQALRGEGFRTSDDVFRSLLHGERRGQEGTPEIAPPAAEDAPKLAARDQGKLPLQQPKEEVPVPRGPVGRAMQQMSTAAKGFSDVIRSAFAPITTGHTTAQAEASRFANADAKVANWAMKIDRALRQDFKPEQRRRMFDAMDDQSLFEIELREAMRDKPPEEAAAIEKAAREAFAGKGIESLPEAERRVVTELDQVSQAVWENERDRGLVGENAQGLPYYTPRHFVQALGEGKAKALPSGGEPASHAIDPLGLNLTTSGPMRRNIRITEDSLRALRAKYADADLVRDIRVLPMTLARGMRSVAGVDLVNAIKAHGKEVGFDPITTDVPPGMASSYRTIDHPALMEWKPALVKGPDGNWVAAKGPGGRPAMVRTPMKVHVDFEGPLRAVLTRPGNKLYTGLLGLKNAAVGMIMYSPMIHNAVEWSRAFPLMGLPMLWGKPYFEGHRLGRDYAYMNDAIEHGLRPVGGSWKADATGIYEQAHGKAGNSYTAKALGAAGDVVNKELGDKMRRAVDTAGEFWHQKLLWDQVRALQIGIYDGMLKRYTEAGTAPDVARYMAAHLANRYAGALPREAMSNAANMAANLGLFSRSFTLGNLGAMKDMFNGMPAYVRAQIEHAAGPEAVKTAKGQLRKKAISAFVVDLGLTYIGNALLQNAIKMALGEEDLDDVAKGYFRRLTRLATGDWESMNPLENLTPNSENEPGKKGRIYAGRDATGTAGYFRNPLGKIGEDFAGWFTDPLNTTVRKMAPMPKAVMEVLTNADSMGKPVRNKEAHGIGGSIDNAGDIVKHIAKSFFPVDALHATWGALRDGVLVAQGKPAQDPHPAMNVAKAVGPLLGVQTSRGYPGGPQEGEMAGILRNHQFARSRAIPEARAKFQRGDEDGARKVLSDAGLTNPEIATAMRGIKTPDRGAISRQRMVSKIASPEQREAIDRLRPRP